MTVNRCSAITFERVIKLLLLISYSCSSTYDKRTPHYASASSLNEPFHIYYIITRNAQIGASLVRLFQLHACPIQRSVWIGGKCTIWLLIEMGSFLHQMQQIKNTKIPESVIQVRKSSWVLHQLLKWYFLFFIFKFHFNLSFFQKKIKIG